ncbi:MAG: ScyD/ScyE family protein [Anaerolineae bacterium]|nr:ScyD/ScyE family protein [Anaerolineae bacterium]
MRLQRLISLSVLMIFVLAALALPALAQEMPPLPGEQVVGDLMAPRGVAFDADGNMIVAVAGSGGAQELVAPGPEGETTFNVGLTGSVISVAADGTTSTLLQGIPSYASPMETTGVYRAIPHDGSLWLLYTSGGPFNPFSNTIVELDMATGFPVRMFSPWSFEVANNPDGNELDSNVTDLAWTADGTMLISDAGANSLYSWTEADGLTVVATWPDNSVPTSVEVAENGDVYVGFLGAGLAPGAGKVERWSNGELAETFGGLNAVSDILVDGDNLYAVELVRFGEEGPGPGGVIMLTADGSTPVADGLVTPFGIAKGPDGALYVSYGTLSFGPPAPGGVVKIDMDM